MKRLGLDLGSSAIKAVVVDHRGTPLHHGEVPCEGAPWAALRSLIGTLGRGQLATAPLRVGVTGRSRGMLIRHLPSFREASDVVAVAAGTLRQHPEARHVVSLGGHYSFWCRLDPSSPGGFSDFSISDLCAAGAGSFLEQQATRLELGVEGLSRVAASARRAPPVAGRCAVFTKSDLIHLQQKGTPLDEIALGLCYALVRTFQAQVLHGRELEGPTVLVGGCARNEGMVRAAQDVLAAHGAPLVIPEHPELIAASGAALLADADPIELATLLEAVRRTEARGATWKTTLPLSAPPQVANFPEPDGEALRDQEVVLGVDVGSVSTNLVLVDRQGTLLDAVYAPTRGRPLEALEQALATLRGRHRRPIDVVGAAATGSGRHLAGHLLGADLVKNEIAAQLRAAVAYRRNVDTVLEIGGQDAKFIRARAGGIGDFAMNRVCAAGTGSFLEEQAQQLGVAIVGEFAERALAALAPVDLGRRCTVFMESEVVAAMAAGAAVEDIAAGLALAVARNYLDRVVGGRSVGDEIVFQGGTAANRAVVAALGQLLGRPVHVHPYHRVSGALGVALLWLDACKQDLPARPSRFRGLASSATALERSFECPQCSVRCQVTRLRSGADVFHFGDVCERYTSRDVGGAEVADPLARRTELLLAASGIEPLAEVPRDALGLPRASQTLALLPWLVPLARAAGRTPYLSSPTTTDTLAVGMRHLTSDTCLPIKATYGQVAELARQGVRQVLMPSVAAFRGDEGLAHSCLFGQHLPWMLSGAVGGVEIIAPELSLDMPRGRRVDELAEAGTALGLSKRDVERALGAGDEAARRFSQELEAWGAEVLAAGHDRIAVVLARPYLLSDPVLNQGVGRHLARLGLPVLPLDALPLGSVTLDARWRDLPWRFSRDLIRAALLVGRDPRLFPVVITSFGCGPDAFTIKHLEALFAGRPHLLLELDEHRSEAGLVTRLEAFADEVAAHVNRGRPAPGASRPPLLQVKKRSRLVVPYFADHAHAQAGILRGAGFAVSLLPPPTRATRERGEALVSGRECHPFAMLAGDLARCLDSGDVGPDDAFFLPGTVVSCLLRQYGDGLDSILQRLGGKGVRLLTPSLDSWPRLVGLPLTIRLGTVLAATDVLLRARCCIRPYELRPGRTDEVYQRCLLKLGQAAEQGHVFETLTDCAADLGAIERRAEVRPLVGVAGDVYTRINDFASDDLFRSLEEAGCEVWPAPFASDVAEYNATRRKQLSWRLRRPRWRLRFGMTARVLTGQRQRIERLFSGIEGLRPELDAPSMQALVRPYLGSAANPLLLLNVGRMLMYAQAGVDGIINASCINCMVGSVSQAFQERLRRDIDRVPITTLVFGGSDGAANRSRLDAFVHQVKCRRAARTAGAVTGARDELR